MRNSECGVRNKNSDCDHSRNDNCPELIVARLASGNLIMCRFSPLGRGAVGGGGEPSHSGATLPAAPPRRGKVIRLGLSNLFNPYPLASGSHVVFAICKLVCFGRCDILTMGSLRAYPSWFRVWDSKADSLGRGRQQTTLAKVEAYDQLC